MSGLSETARALVAGKGILAADESNATIKKRFDTIGVESTEEHRRAYRDTLLSAPGLEEYISGVILYDETIRQHSADGTPFPELLSARGILPGIKVDLGLKDLAGAPGEKLTEGLDGLRERLQEYHALGARFAKWRTVYSIADGLPSDCCIEANAHVQAYYAALCVEQGLVPIVEPEVLMDGAHSAEACQAASERTLKAVFARLALYQVPFDQMLLKTNMVVSGKSAGQQASVEEVARRTLALFRAVLPDTLPGVVFLSGGQTEQEATEHLDAMNRMGDLPWTLSFSYGRALQASALETWAGKPENVPAAQQVLLHRSRLNAMATQGRYERSMEDAA